MNLHQNAHSQFSAIRRIARAGLLVFLLVSPAACAEKQEFQFKKEPEIQQVKPKKPVKIKLKRSAKDDYTWELSGDDVDEIVKTDRKLRKQLGVQ